MTLGDLLQQQAYMATHYTIACLASSEIEGPTDLNTFQCVERHLIDACTINAMMYSSYRRAEWQLAHLMHVIPLRLIVVPG